MSDDEESVTEPIGVQLDPNGLVVMALELPPRAKSSDWGNMTWTQDPHNRR